MFNANKLFGLIPLLLGGGVSGNFDTCPCDNNQSTDLSKVYVAGLFDTLNFDWGPELFHFIVDLINDHEDGWFDDVLNDGTTLVAAVEDAGCDPQVALPAYWDLKTDWGKPLHGVVGCRCSGATASVARVASLEDIPVVSPASSSARLSDTTEFPTFSRLVGPDNEKGQVGALVNMLRFMGWDRVTVLQTDTAYTKDLSTAFGNAWVGEHEANVETGSAAWTGEVAYSHPIGLNPDGTLDEDSARKALASVPTDEPRINSRVIVLLAHDQHAYPILKLAQETKFQPDTIWVGTDAWSGSTPPGGDTSWMPVIPGYIALEPYRNQNMVYEDFLWRLQESQEMQGRDVMQDLPNYAAETMHDSLVALAMALSAVSPDRRSNGTEVLSELRKLSFEGVSGPVSFTVEGDRADPRYSVVNWKDGGWEVVGEASPTRAHVSVTNVCWAGIACGLSVAPSEKYPVPPPKLPVWVYIIIPVSFIITIALGLRYWRSHKKKKLLKRNISEMQAKMDKMKGIDSELADLDDQVKEAKRKQADLIQQRVGLQETPPTWTDSDETLVELFPDEDEFWAVSKQLRANMNDAWITKVWRVQNHPLWNYYNFHKNRLSINGIDHNEKSVWHGTSSLDPAIVYDDQQDGFMMQFSQKGFWGRGIYFAHKSSYSHSYGFRVEGSAPTERPEGSTGEREMFLAKLLTGNETLMDRDQSSAKATECRNLTAPPVNPQTNMKYNTVSGFTAGSQVWIVYENGRAYPEYLVRYYRGTRDTSRTPFETKEEATKAKESMAEEAPTLASTRVLSWFRQSDTIVDQAELGQAPNTSAVANGSGVEGKQKVTWEYLDAKGTWTAYGPLLQGIIEGRFQKDLSPQQAVVQFKSGEWRYEVNMKSMEQTNIEHHAHTKRKVRRRQH